MDGSNSYAVGYQFDPICDSLSEPHFRDGYDKNEETNFSVRLIMSAEDWCQGGKCICQRRRNANVVVK